MADDPGPIVLAAARKWLGTTYAWGGGDMSGPTLGIRDGGVADRYGDYLKIGFDCSGLTQYAWGQVGVDIGGDSTTQHARVPRISQPRPGCIMWWPGHVALYIDSTSMIEAPQSGDVVKVSKLRSGAVFHWPNGPYDLSGSAGVLSDGSGGVGLSHTTVGSVTGVSTKALVTVGVVAIIGLMIVFSVGLGD